MVDTYQDRLVHFAFCRVENQQDAEDIVQDALVRAYIHRHKLKKITNPGPYLYRMVSNLCTDLLRKRSRSGVVGAEVQAEMLVSGSPNALDSALTADRQRRINRLLDQLPLREAEVVRLRVFAELPFRDIAKVVRRPLPTVKSRFRYGIEKLRRVLSKEVVP